MLLTLDVISFELATIWPMLDTYSSLFTEEPLTLISLFVQMHCDTDAMLEVVHKASSVYFASHVVEGAIAFGMPENPFTLI